MPAYITFSSQSDLTPISYTSEFELYFYTPLHMGYIVNSGTNSLFVVIAINVRKDFLV